MDNSPAQTPRGKWNTKAGFVLAAAGSAVGLGNIWGFPTQVADNGGAAFILVYLLCCLVIGFPVMIAELTIGRRTQKSPVGAFRDLGNNNFFASIIGYWAVLCSVMILTFYLVLSGWTLGYVLEELFYFFGATGTADVLGDLGHGLKNAVFAVIFMFLTVTIITGGVSQGIERATKLLMPVLIAILVIMAVYVITLPGSAEGLSVYFMPDFSTVDGSLVLSAMGQAFFSLSLGMGVLITYGSYLKKDQNVVESAAYVTFADIGIAILAGLLVIPAMFAAQAAGVQILGPDGALISSVTLVFDVLPEMFHSIGGILGLILGVSFFVLLALAALTSSISLLEVPVSFIIDEYGISRKYSARMVGSLIGLFAVIVSFDTSLIDVLVAIFNEVGLPLSGLMLCVFLGYFWKTENALIELEQGFTRVASSGFGPLWVVFIKFICPILIAIVLGHTLYQLL